MLITLLYFSGFQLWKLLLALLASVLCLFVLVGLPLGVLVFVAIKFLKHRKDISAVKDFDAEQ